MADQQSTALDHPKMETSPNPVNKDGMENMQPQPSHNEQDISIDDAETLIPKKALPEKAKVFCNCCNWSSQACGIFWAFFNLAQVIICYAVLIFELSFSEGINTTVDGFQKNLFELNYNSSAECIEHLKVSGAPNSAAKLSIQIIMLVFYTIGSISFCLAVFLKCLNVRRKSICLLIYLATILCLPLAYFIPLMIVYSGCVYAGLGLTILWLWWYLTLGITTGLAINITFVFRDWVLKKQVLDSIPPPSEQQSVQMGGEPSNGNGTGKETNDDKNATDDKKTSDAKSKAGAKNKTDAKDKANAKNDTI